MTKNRILILVGIFSIAMAYLESAVVVYLREMYGIVDLIKDTPLTPDKYTTIEIGREAATLVMLLMIGLISGNNKHQKIGYSIFAFGIWDIFYYIWLFIFVQWPKSLLEWDILFLIPLPWWGPVITPILISLVLILIGYFLITIENIIINKIDWMLFYASILIIFFTFMEGGITAVISCNVDLNNLRPTNFNWILFLIGYAGMATSGFRVIFRARSK
jgi:hypothetical protein